MSARIRQRQRQRPPSPVVGHAFQGCTGGQGGSWEVASGFPLAPGEPFEVRGAHGGRETRPGSRMGLAAGTPCAPGPRCTAVPAWAHGALTGERPGQRLRAVGAMGSPGRRQLPVSTPPRRGGLCGGVLCGRDLGPTHRGSQLPCLLPLAAGRAPACSPPPRPGSPPACGWGGGGSPEGSQPWCRPQLLSSIHHLSHLSVCHLPLMSVICLMSI